MPSSGVHEARRPLVWYFANEQNISPGRAVVKAWLDKPRTFGPSRGYPIIVYVYGEPADTTVTDRCGGSGRVLSAASRP